MKLFKNVSITATFLSAAVLTTAMSLFLKPLPAFAQNNTFEPSGKFYEFDEKSHYEIDGATPLSSKPSTLGSFTLSGDAKSISATNGFESYEVKDGALTLNYKLGSTLTGDTATNWHVVDDKSKIVNGCTLDENILKASVIIQTSLTGEDTDWVTDVVKTNIVADTQFDPNIYLTREIQQINGCYYRIIVAYELSRQVEDKKVLFASFDNFEDKKCAEVYQFYVINSAENASESISPTATPRKELGKVIKVPKDKGFAGSEPIDNKDPHFGWDIGTFFLNGYTREQPVGDNETPIFLKTVGDRVDMAGQCLNMAFETASSETVDNGKIFSPQNWIKAKASLKDIRSAVKNQMSALKFAPGGKEIIDKINAGLKMSTEDFESRWTAD